MIDASASVLGDPFLAASVVADAESALGVADLVPLGRGGQKLVLECVAGDRRAVAKIVLVPPGVEAGFVVARARREVGVLAAVDSPRVVGVLGDVVELRSDGTSTYAVAWVEEFLDGVDLDTQLGPRWEIDRAARLVVHLGQALAAFHREGIVHRDLSPVNIRQRSDGGFVLMDPGLARYLSENAVCDTFRIGTIGYQSPEHVPGFEVRPDGDVFVLGVLAYQALTGELPVTIRTIVEYLDAMHRGGFPSVASQRSDVPPELGRIVDRCLRRRPEDRFATGEALLAELEAVGGVFGPHLR